MGLSATGSLSTIRARIREHGYFLVFLASLVVYVSFLQIELASVLARLFLVRVFFQVSIAALVIAFVRNLVGVRTLGMFGPAIIALAFLATGLPLGLALLGLILGVVVLTRGVLIREKVQAAHRVAILVTVVSVTISSIAILGLEFQQHELFFSVLFPVLISAWIGERYVEQVTRVGWEGPSKALGWTVAAIILSFLVITQDAVVDFVMLNPLTWALLVLLNWFSGTRVRFRLSERFRFLGVRRWSLADVPIQGNFQNDVLTIIMRNRNYVDNYNPPDLMARLGKEEAKALLVAQGIPVSRTYLLLRERRDIDRLAMWLQTNHKFALKPGSGYGGEGILLAKGFENGLFQTNRGLMNASQIVAHASAIIDGEFHEGQSDSAVVEELLVQHKALKLLVPLGLADVRVISFLGYPTMAMLRLPTKASGGRANLHMGAIGAGVKLSTGTIIHSVWKGLPQAYHPDTGEIILGKQLPYWEETLEIAADAQRLTGLGFAGVDVVVDADKGPIVMEVNRRPGLEIQMANASGLLRRLRMIEALQVRDLPVEERLQIAKRMDGENWGLGPLQTQPSWTGEIPGPLESGSPGDGELENKQRARSVHDSVPVPGIVWKNLARHLLSSPG